jgi:hypothetical protein
MFQHVCYYRGLTLARTPGDVAVCLGLLLDALDGLSTLHSTAHEAARRDAGAPALVDPLRAVRGESLRCRPTWMTKLLRALLGPNGQWLMLIAKMRTVGADGGTVVCGCCRECQPTAMTMFGLSYEGALLTCGRSSTCERRARSLCVDPDCCTADARDADDADVVADNAAGDDEAAAWPQAELGYTTGRAGAMLAEF